MLQIRRSADHIFERPMVSFWRTTDLPRHLHVKRCETLRAGQGDFIGGCRLVIRSSFGVVIDFELAPGVLGFEKTEDLVGRQVPVIPNERLQIASLAQKISQLGTHQRSLPSFVSLGDG